MFDQEEDSKKYFSFSVSGGDRSVEFSFNLDKDVTWMHILPFFLDFLKANGYLFENNHELYGMCKYEGE